MPMCNDTKRHNQGGLLMTRGDLGSDGQQRPGREAKGSETENEKS